MQSVKPIDTSEGLFPVKPGRNTFSSNSYRLFRSLFASRINRLMGWKDCSLLCDEGRTWGCDLDQIHLCLRYLKAPPARICRGPNIRHRILRARTSNLVFFELTSDNEIPGLQDSGPLYWACAKMERLYIPMYQPLHPIQDSIYAVYKSVLAKQS